MREVPKCAKSQTADDSGQYDLRPRLRHPAPFNALWDFAHYGISRTMGLRALRDFAPFGTSRPLGLRALWDLAPFEADLNRLHLPRIREPGVVLRKAAVHRPEVRLLDAKRDRSRLASSHRTAVHLRDRRNLDRRAGEERLIGSGDVIERE